MAAIRANHAPVIRFNPGGHSPGIPRIFAVKNKADSRSAHAKLSRDVGKAAFLYCLLQKCPPFAFTHETSLLYSDP